MSQVCVGDPAWERHPRTFPKSLAHKVTRKKKKKKICFFELLNVGAACHIATVAAGWTSRTQGRTWARGERGPFAEVTPEGRPTPRISFKDTGESGGKNRQVADESLFPESVTLPRLPSGVSAEGVCAGLGCPFCPRGHSLGLSPSGGVISRGHSNRPSALPRRCSRP